jgi:hypothetical protein
MALRALAVAAAAAAAAAVAVGSAAVPAAAPAPAAPPNKLKGFVLTSYAAGGYSGPGTAAVVAEMAAAGVEVVEVMFTWYVDNVVNATAVAPHPPGSPTDADVVAAIDAVASAGLTVALKPHIDSLDGVWRAFIGTQYTSEAQWAAFFSNYTAFITHAAGLCAGRCAYFNVGTELDGSFHREPEWRAVIAAVRAAVPPATRLWLGPNWNWQGLPGYQRVAFWDALDYLGVDFYAPVAGAPDPTLATAVAGWAPYIANLTSFWATVGGGTKPFIFAEIGYASYADAAVNAPGCCTGPPDPATQATLYSAFFAAAWDAPFMGGAFWWAWDASGAAGNPCSTDFSVYRKPAAAVLSAAYGGRRAPAAAAAAAAAAAPRDPAAPAPVVVYANGTSAWEDWSWGGVTVDFSVAGDAYPGHAASAVATWAAGNTGAVSLHFPGAGGAPLNVTGFTALTFDVRVPNASDAAALTAWLCSAPDCPQSAGLPTVQVVDYGTAVGSCALPTDWAADPAAARVSIPLSALGVADPAVGVVSRVSIGAYGVEAGFHFGLDNVVFE